jgi:hypothetical protein
MPQIAEATRFEHDQSRAPEYGAKAPRTSQPVVETSTEARQGVTGQGVRYVLLFGLAGVVIAFALIYAAFFA